MNSALKIVQKNWRDTNCEKSSSQKKPPVNLYAGAHADFPLRHQRFQHEMIRDDGSTFIPSPPIRNGIMRGLIAMVRAYVNRPYPRRRAF